MKIPFTKMHGLGNDFVVIDRVSNSFNLGAEQIRYLSDRHFGIGCDQVLLIDPPSDPAVEFDYRIFNIDGEEVEHCGNGARCFASYVHDKGLTRSNPVLVKTVNRILELAIDEQGEVSVDMGPPDFSPAMIPFKSETEELQYSRQLEINGESLTVSFSALTMGNPHAVLLVEDLDKSAVTDIGRALGSHPDFPAGVNVGFMQILAEDEIALRVFERGSGETLACGTGACAAVATGCLLGRLGDTVKVHLPGGQLKIHWPRNQQDDGPDKQASITMTGPTTTVYEGTIEL
jgi:diaminopimelate epimerase